MIATRRLLQNGALALGLLVCETVVATVVGGFVGYYAGPRPTAAPATPARVAYTVRWAGGRLLVEEADPDARYAPADGAFLYFNGLFWQAIQ